MDQQQYQIFLHKGFNDTPNHLLRDFYIYTLTAETNTMYMYYCFNAL